jgi:hypothetical protein
MAGIFSKKRASSGLVAEQRMDVNGRLVTRHVRADNGNNAPSEALMGQTTAGTEASVGLPPNVNWDDCSPKKVGKLLAQINDDISNPDRVWENFDLCTSLLASKYGPASYHMVGSIKDKLPLAWAAKQGVTLGTDAAYSLEGDEGFSSLYAARDGLDSELMRARSRGNRASREEFEANSQASDQIASAMHKSKIAISPEMERDVFTTKASHTPDEPYKKNLIETIEGAV